MKSSQGDTRKSQVQLPSLHPPSGRDRRQARESAVQALGPSWLGSWSFWEFWAVTHARTLTDTRQLKHPTEHPATGYAVS